MDLMDSHVGGNEEETNPYLVQLPQIQYLGMLAIKKILEDTNF